MPDTFTHIMLPALLRRYIKLPIFMPLFLIGTVIPDYSREFFILVLPVSWYAAVMVFHSLTGTVLSAVFLSVLFQPRIRKFAFLSLLLGQWLHLIFDAFLHYHCGGPLYLFLPLWQSFSFALIEESDWINIFFFTVIISVGYGLVSTYRYYKSGKQRQ